MRPTRQVRAARKLFAMLAVLVILGLGATAAEVSMHGVPFFVFRNADAGAGNSADLQESQAPGQPGGK